MSTKKFEPDHAEEYYLDQPKDENNPNAHQLMNE